jgi:integrase
MTVIRVKGFKIFRDRHGKLRCYHRATGHKIDLERAPFGTVAFIAECGKITALAEARKSTEPKAGTLGGVVASYYAEAHFRNLSDRTKRDYRRCAAFIGNILDTPIQTINTPLLCQIHDKAESKIGWRQANMLMSFLSQVFSYGVPRGLVAVNYAAAVKPKPRPKTLARANRPWTAEELAAVLTLAPAHIRAAVALMAYTGLDPSDALTLRRSAIVDGDLSTARGKTGQKVELQITQTLRAALNDAPRHDAVTILATTRGLPWTYDGFSTVWHRFKAKQVEAGKLPADLTLKGLRHTVATVLREAGVSPRSIADLLGQKTEAMAQHYSRDASLAASNRKTMEILEFEIERRTKSVNPAAKSVKPE